ncbi:MAG TPA: tripartite tricarboxylate transporter substrate binding protein [Burkholderiales bacterium]|jgi:tripartite-type tricarboxylate transporter receptor subunit TctC|nr:tripartite tricarboxylate transporter substrate binding protein [Burkholderiales bacterium]
MRFIVYGFSLLVTAFCTGALAADAYPTKPVRFVITFPAGGPTDVVVRLVGQRLTEEWGQPMIIDNRGGAGGIVGTEIVARAAPDGYSFLVGTAGGMTINPALQPKLSYDPFRDFSPVSMLVTNPQILVAHPSVAAKNVKELVALAKAKPGQLNFASAGTGTATHLGLELLKLTTGLDAVHVPYKGGAPAVTDLIAGQVQLLWVSIPSVLPHVKGGRLRALAVSTAKRSASAPDVPTVAESGYPGFEYSNWNALFAPAKTPTAVVRKVNASVVKALSEPEVAQRLSNQGADPAPGTPEELARYMRVDSDRWKKVIKSAGIKPD